MAEHHPPDSAPPTADHPHEHAEGSERMREVVRDGFTIMIGAASWAFEQGDRLVDTWLHQGRESREEGRRRLDELAERTRRTRDDLSRRLQDGVRSARSSMPLATREQIANLERQVAHLTREIEALRAQSAAPPARKDRSSS